MICSSEPEPILVSGANAAPTLPRPHRVEEPVDVEYYRRRRLAGRHLLEMPHRQLVLTFDEEGPGELRANALQSGPPTSGCEVRRWPRPTVPRASLRERRDVPIIDRPKRNVTVASPVRYRASGRGMASIPSNQSALIRVRACSIPLLGGWCGGAFRRPRTAR